MNSVLFLLRSFVVGGAERQLCVLASGLQQSKYSVKVAVFYAGGPLEAEAKRMGIEIMDLKRKGRWDLLPFFLRLIKLIRTERPDVLHSYLQVPNLWAAFVKLVLPRTKVVWGIRASNVEWKHYGWQAQLTDRTEALLARIPNRIICNSQAGLLHAVKRGYPREKMSLIPNGIDTRHFIPDPKRGHQRREQWGVRENQKLIGIVGRVDPIKDYSSFLQACALLLAERRAVRFVCVGAGKEDLIAEYRELARSLHLNKYLIWAGEQADMLSVYNALDILVMSSISEGLPNVVGEAMACGVPCVVTNVGDSAQLVGELGEIVPPQDSRALKQGILNLLTRLEKEGISLNKAAARRINEHFNVETLVNRTAGLLDELITGQTVNKEKALETDLL